MTPPPALTRDLTALAQPFDVIVIGGGISGVQIARHAAGRGLRTLLAERDDFSSGTSSATTKAIHGGLRYLEQFEFGVVQESISERHAFGVTAPHLVEPRRFLLTAWNWSKPPAAVLGAGVAVYEAMAWRRNRGVPADRRAARFRWVGKKELLRRVPWFDPDGLVGAWDHGDSINLHPERLLLSLVKSTVELGGVAVNHAAVTGFTTETEAGDRVRVTGVVLTDQLTGTEHRVAGRVVINAAGPWVDTALGDLAPKSGIRVRRAKGVHLVTRSLGNLDSVFTRGKDGPHFVVNQWRDRSLIGPTDTTMTEDADAATVTDADIDALLSNLNSISARRFTRADVLTALVGVRPLVDDGKPTYKASRRFDIHRHAERGIDGLYSVTGGKWTTARAMAAEVVDRVVAGEPDLPPTRSFDSRFLPVTGAFAGARSMEAAFESALLRRPELDVPRDVRLHLARLYGTEHEAVLDLVAQDPALGERLSSTPGRLDIAAQVVHAVTAESAYSLNDLIDRRLTVGTLPPVEPAEVRRVAALAAPLLGWDEAREHTEVARYLAAQDSRQGVIHP